MHSEFLPKSYSCLTSGYCFSTFRKDTLAGITVGIVALPLAMAFAIASGALPFQGLITAIIAGFLISCLGGSKVQIGGPTGAFVILIYDIIQRSGYQGLVTATLIASFLLVCFGFFRLGSWIKFIPYPLITGLTTGIAVLIFSSQINDFLGLSLTVPCHFVEKWSLYLGHLSSCQFYTICVSFGTLLLSIIIRKYFPRLPWAITSLILSGFICYIFSWPVETLHSKFGKISFEISMPNFSLLHISHQSFSQLFLDAIAIAFLGGIESLLSAVIGDGMIGSRHRSNCELVAQGIANFFSVLFGGIPATGAIARTAINVKSGGTTPVAGMVHALTLLIIVLFLSPGIGYIPMPALAAMLVLVSWNMSELSHFVKLFKAPLGDVTILITTFLLTVLVDITIAIFLGMVLSSFLFMKRMSDLSKTASLKKAFQEQEESPPKQPIPGIEVYEIQGPFFFGTADILQNVLFEIENKPKIFILRLQSVHFIDASAMHALKEFHEKCKNKQISLFLSEVPSVTKKDLERFGFVKVLGRGNIFATFHLALSRAKDVLNCSNRLLHEK